MATKTRPLSHLPETMSVRQYLEECKTEPMLYATVWDRILKAIGEGKPIDYDKDARMRRIFQNKYIYIYDSFFDFSGMENTVADLVSYFKQATQGTEERKQVLYLLGPVGSGKSSLAERVKQLAEVYPIFVLEAKNRHADKWETSPVFESPLGLFEPDGSVAGFGVDADAPQLSHIPSRHLTGIISPWAVKRLDHDLDRDWERFRVRKLYPSRLRQIAICKTEPADENTQDISSLVGKINIRQMENFDENDSDAYSYSGGLCRSNQGVLEFVEMFKAPIKTLNPLLTATQERNYKGTQEIGAIPFTGMIMAHSNESEWKKFSENRDNEAFLDRVVTIKVPYTLRYSDESEIYKKMIRSSDLDERPCAPATLEMLGRFSVLTRLAPADNLWAKMQMYNGDDISEKAGRAKSLKEYRDEAGINEGMTGFSTRFAFKTISSVFNYDPREVAANPVHLLLKLNERVAKLDASEDKKKEWRAHLDTLKADYLEFLEKELQVAYIESYDEYGQNLFDRYVMYTDKWIQREDHRDPSTGLQYTPEALNQELEKIEKPAGISNPKDFRHEVLNFVLRVKANTGKNPSWKSFEKMRVVIEKRMFSKTEDILPVISYNPKASEEEQKKHKGFVERMKGRGYTELQVRTLVDWYLQAKKS